MDEIKKDLRCGVCSKYVNHSRGRYEGHFVPTYKLFVCNICWQANWDGWGPAAEAALLAHLEKEGIPVPPRNEKGYIPRG